MARVRHCVKSWPNSTPRYVEAWQGKRRLLCKKWKWPPSWHQHQEAGDRANSHLSRPLPSCSHIGQEVDLSASAPVPCFYDRSAPVSRPDGPALEHIPHKSFLAAPLKRCVALTTGPLKRMSWCRGGAMKRSDTSRHVLTRNALQLTKSPFGTIDLGLLFLPSLCGPRGLTYALLARLCSVAITPDIIIARPARVGPSLAKWLTGGARYRRASPNNPPHRRASTRPPSPYRGSP